MKIEKVQKYISARLIFSRWKRKGYSIFQTLNRVVVISVLLTPYLIAVPDKSIASDSDTTEIKMQFDIDEVEVSAQRSPALYSQIARIVAVINRNEIKLSPAKSVQELLEYVAGVDIRQRGANGVQADISIRGGTFDQTIILLNGINITDPQTGHHNLNLPVSLNQIDRIEVLEGPAGRVYGPNAFSGALNIVTRTPEKSLIDFDLSGGSFGYFDGSLFGAINSKKLNQQFAVSRNSSKGYIDNTDYGLSNVFYSNSLNSDKGKLLTQIGYAEKAFGANSFYTPKYPNQYEETKTLFSSVKWESNSKFHLTPVIYWRNHHDKFELFRNNPPDWYLSHNYHLTNTYGINLNSWVQWSAGKSAFGIEYRSENILSNVLGNDMDRPKRVSGENAKYTKSDSRNYVSGFLEHTYFYNNWTISAGLLGNYIYESNLGLNLFPGLDISFQIARNIKVFSSYNTSLRMPTFTDLYYSGPTNIGNANLKPEKSSALEGGVRFNSKLVSGQWVIFYQSGKNIIDWVKMENDELWQPQNLTSLNSMGTELQLEFELKKYLGNGFPNKIYLNYFYNNLSKENSDFISNYVLDNLAHKLVLSINQNIIKMLSVNVTVNFQDREGTYAKFENGNTLGEVEYDPFWLFDGKLNYNYKKCQLFLAVSNIFNIKYFDIGNVSQPGRWVKAGISYQLDFLHP